MRVTVVRARVAGHDDPSSRLADAERRGVVAAAVIFDPETFIPEINDSKQLKESERERLFEVIVREAIGFGVGIISSEIVDEINILQASLLAMTHALHDLKIQPDYLLVDGTQGVDFNLPQKSIVKGDSLSMSIGAASILAKVTRDRLMKVLEKDHPGFAFGKHKGYGTKEHQEELKKNGPTSIHRKSFRPIREILSKN